MSYNNRKRICVDRCRGLGYNPYIVSMLLETITGFTHDATAHATTGSSSTVVNDAELQEQKRGPNTVMDLTGFNCVNRTVVCMWFPFPFSLFILGYDYGHVGYGNCTKNNTDRHNMRRIMVALRLDQQRVAASRRNHERLHFNIHVINGLAIH